MKVFGILLVLFLSVMLVAAQDQGQDLSGASEIFYGAMLTGGTTCDVTKSVDTITLPDYLKGSGKAEITAGAGYVGAISTLMASLTEKAKANPVRTTDAVGSLINKAVWDWMKMKFEAECNNNQAQGGSGGKKRQACSTLFDNFLSYDSSADAQSRGYLQQFGASSPFGLRENPLDPRPFAAEVGFDAELNLWGLIVDRLLGLLGGEVINPALTSHWKSLVKNWFTTSQGLDLEALAMWAFATDDVSEEWDAALSASYESLSIKGKIFFAFYLKNKNVNVGLSGATLARERIDLYQNVLKLAMDKIRIDHFGNTAFVTIADFTDGPERPEWQATSMLLFLITKFGIPFDIKPTKMANFLASFGRQGDLEFPIEKFKSFNDSKDIVWAIVALATRQVTVKVDLDLKVVVDTQQLINHHFTSCCDAHVKTSWNRLQELSGGKTVAFDACGSGDISIAIRFTRDMTQGGSAGGSEGGSAGGSAGGSEGGSAGGSEGGSAGGSEGGSAGGSEGGSAGGAQGDQTKDQPGQN